MTTPQPNAAKRRKKMRKKMKPDRSYYVECFMFRKRRGMIAPCFGVHPTKANAQRLFDRTALLRRSYVIVKAYISEGKP